MGPGTQKVPPVFYNTPVSVTDLNASRASLFVQLLGPPLPIVCTNSSGAESFSSSHDLLSCIFGRLLQINDRNVFRGAYPTEEFDGDWQSHLLLGEHATELLKALVAITAENKEVNKNTGVPFHPQTLLEKMQPHFHAYTRQIVTLAMGYDLFTSGCPASRIPQTQDVRFLLDSQRINMATHRHIVLSTVDFFCSLLCFRCGATDQEVMQCRKNLSMQPMKYDHTLLKCMNLIRDLAPEILQGELERQGVIVDTGIPVGPE